MAKRYMISPVAGEGLTEDDRIRAAVDDVSNTYSNSVIPQHLSGPDIGQAKYRFTVAIVGTSNLGAVAQLTNSYLFPDITRDSKLSTTGQGDYDAMVQNLAQFDLDGEGLHFNVAWITPDHTLFDVILNLIQQLDPLYPNHLNGFDIQEPGVGA